MISKLFNLLKRVENILNSDVGIPTTSNGVYNVRETHLRALSHELNMMLIPCFKTNENRSSILLNRLDELIQANELLIHNSGLDATNGVIGGAWVIEGLLAAYTITSDEKYLEAASEVVAAHNFDASKGLWYRPNGRLDQTINHQIWFAFALYQLYKANKNEDLLSMVLCFMDGLGAKLHLYEDGVMHHRSLKGYDLRSRLSDIKNKISGNKVIRDINLVHKSYGYFPFVMLPLSYLSLSQELESTNFFKSPAWIKMKQAIQCPRVIDIIHAERKYGLKYNLCTVELIVIYDLLDYDIDELLEKYIDVQMEVFEKLNNDDLNLAYLKLYEMKYKKW